MADNLNDPKARDEYVKCSGAIKQIMNTTILFCFEQPKYGTVNGSTTMWVPCAQCDYQTIELGDPDLMVSKKWLEESGFKL